MVEIYFQCFKSGVGSRKYLQYPLRSKDYFFENIEVDNFKEKWMQSIRKPNDQIFINSSEPSVIYLVINEDKRTVISAHLDLEVAKRKADDYLKNEPQFQFMVIELEIN